MKEYETNQIRNIVLLGHQSSGKTTLTESLLYVSQNRDRMGTIEAGNTISDYDIEEQKRGMSIHTSVVPIEYEGVKVNILDTPGYLDFVSDAISAIHVCESALMTVSARSGVKVGTEWMWEYALRESRPLGFVMTKLDVEGARYEEIIQQLKERYDGVVEVVFPVLSGNEWAMIDLIQRKMMVWDEKKFKLREEAIPLHIQDEVEERRNDLMEHIAECDERLLECYFENGKLTVDEMIQGLREGFASGMLHPVWAVSAATCQGTALLLRDMLTFFPKPKVVEEQLFSAQVFKTMSDPFVGRLSYFKVKSGHVTSDTTLYNRRANEKERNQPFYYVKGKALLPIERLAVGDIGIFTKLQFAQTGDTMSENENVHPYEPAVYPQGTLSMAVVPKTTGDEDRMSVSIQRILEEQPSITQHHAVECNETILTALGMTQLEYIVGQLHEKFNVDVELRTPRIPYREAISLTTSAQGKHKKQSGGHGQYGDVWIKFEQDNVQCEELHFVDNVVGGSVPRSYIPAVEKGLQECMKHGTLAGYPVVGLKATLYDGSSHPVDSSEMAFKMAASIAFKKAMDEGKAILLEPIMELKITIPAEYIGDIMSDMTRKRGRVTSMEEVDGKEIITAEVPLAEIQTFTTELKALTAAKGMFIERFLRYDLVPETLYESIINEPMTV